MGKNDISPKRQMYLGKNKAAVKEHLFTNKTVNYFDLGLHTAVELRWMIKGIFRSLNIINYKAYGFEAHPEHFSNIIQSKQFQGCDNVFLYNKAICSDNKPVKLYIHPNRVGHSIYDTKTGVQADVCIEVEGVKFSDFILNNVPNFYTSVNILRANIEGAEYDLMNDLIDSDLLKHFNILCGSFGDVEKISELKDKQEYYFELFKKHNKKVHRFSDWKPLRNAHMLGIIKKEIYEN